MAGVKPGEGNDHYGKKKHAKKKRNLRHAGKENIPEDVQQGRYNKQHRHQDMAKRVVDHRIVIVDGTELIEVQPRRKAGERPDHQQRRAGKGKRDSDKIQPPFVTPVFHHHKAGDNRMKDQQKTGQRGE